MEQDIFGAVDTLTICGASGWAWHSDATHDGVFVEAIYNGEVIGRAIANEVRKDLVGPLGDGRCGFSLSFDIVLPKNEGLSFIIKSGAREARLETPKLSAFEGFVDSIDYMSAIGWVWRPDAPATQVKVEVLDEQEVIGSAIADEPRPDLITTGRGTGRYGFNFRFRRSAHQINTLVVRVSDGLEQACLAFHPVDESYLEPAHLKDDECSAKSAQESKIEDRSCLNSDLLDYLSGVKSDYEIIVGSGIFDPEWYLSSNPDVAEAGMDPISHFCACGYKEGRKPNFYFDTATYFDRISIEDASVSNPLVHYILIGEKAGINPAIYFDVAWYADNHNLINGQSPLAHYLSNIDTGLVSPIPDFDVVYYLGQNQDVALAAIDPFCHYAMIGFREGRNPSASFNTQAYIRKNLDGQSEVCPLLHFLVNGRDPSLLEANVDNTTTYAREIKKFVAPGGNFQEFIPAPANALPRAKVLAYYLPQFHVFPENDAWWGTGFTEWTNIPRGTPRFEGHYQPRIPRDLGFYSLTTNETIKKQVELAKKAGIFGFVFYYYQFGNKRMMEAPLDRILEDKTIELPFCLMWANENWTRTWDGFEKDILIGQTYAPEDDDVMLKNWMRYCRDERYIRIGGRPVIMIYRPGIIPDIHNKVVVWRETFVARGERSPIFIMAQGFGDVNPLKFGFDGAIEFPPHKVAAGLRPLNDKLQILDPDFSGTVFDYQDVVDRSVNEPAPDYPLIKAAFPSWDNDARRQGSGMVIHGSTPEAYQNWLEQLISFARHNPFFGEQLVCVNAWNEWAEGAYLEPDLHFGHAYLNATSRAVFGITKPNLQKICLVGHDAHPHGAQLLLKNLAETLVRCFGLEVEIVLLEGGRLVSTYREIAETTIAANDEDLRATFQRLARKGFRAVIVNSSASSAAVKHASAANLRVTMLVHELPSIIAEKTLGPKISRAAPFVDQFVFPAKFVREAFLNSFEVDASRTVVRPQGSYTTFTFSPDERSKMRALLNIGTERTVVLGVGFADLRKGFDIFMNSWRACERAGGGIHFVWLGGLDPNIKVYLKSEIDAAVTSGRFHIASFAKDVASYYSAADLFLLSSREDPFPTVVLEGLQSGIPSIAFAGSGGIPEMLELHDAGAVVAMADAEAVAAAIPHLRKKWPTSERSNNRLVDIARTHFSFTDYAFELMAASQGGLPKISVVVPNYNYAAYMRGRLGSIFNQTCPVFEIIVLDDCSKDDSLQELAKIAEETGRQFSVIPNEINSGSVFRQWRKAADLARGELLWIAEADDDAAPEFLERLTQLFKIDPSLALAYSDSKAVDENGNVLSESYKCYYNEVVKKVFDSSHIDDGRDFVVKYLSQRNIIMNVSACLWRRSALLAAFDAVGDALYQFRVAGDWRLYVEALRAPGVRIAYEAETLNMHRRHSGSVTHSALKAEQHIKEVRGVQEVVAGGFALTEAEVTQQELYITKLTKQLISVNKID